MTPGFLSLTPVSSFYVKGPDAERYLNSRLTSNVLALDNLEGRVSSALNAQGKISAILWIGKLEDSFFLYAPYCAKDSLKGVIEAFKVADQFETTVAEDLAFCIHLTNSQLLHELNLPLPESPASFQREEQCIVVRVNRCSIDGVDILCTKNQGQKFLEILRERAQEIRDSEFIFHRAISNLPMYPFELHDGRLLLEGNTSSYVSENKGCYVGQEVVEKLETRGKTAFIVAPFTTQKLYEGSIESLESTLERSFQILSLGHNQDQSKSGGFLRMRRADHETGKSISKDTVTLTFL